MKIIDLLDKIANGEEVPKEIIYDNIKYSWCSQCKIYERVKDGSKDLYNDLGNLNDEIVILDDEEKGLPEKLNVEKDGDGRIDGIYMGRQEIDERTRINEIIDYLEKQRKGE